MPAAKPAEIVHCATPDVVFTGITVQPEMGFPLLKNAMLPENGTGEVLEAETVALTVTDWFTVGEVGETSVGAPTVVESAVTLCVRLLLLVK